MKLPLTQGVTPLDFEFNLRIKVPPTISDFFHLFAALRRVVFEPKKLILVMLKLNVFFE